MCHTPSPRQGPLLCYLAPVALLFLSAAAAAGYLPVAAPVLARWLMLAEHPPLVLDIRGPGAYRKGTVPGAINAGSDSAGFLPRGDDQPVVLVPSQPPEPAQLDAWQRRLTQAGHRVHVLAGGLPAWRRAGLRVEVPTDSHTRAGMVPFVIPRGLCEQKKPVQSFR